MNDIIFINDDSTLYNNLSNNWNLLIVDDDEEVHSVTKLTLNKLSFMNKPINFISAFSAKEAIKILESSTLEVSVILLDVVMEEIDSGFKVVKYIREQLKNKKIRIILRTGQPGFAPERDVILTYDINDYKEKSELTSQKLFSSVISALRTFNDITIIEGNRTELEILNAKLKKAHERIVVESQAKSNFVRNINHELRTPMAGIVGSVSILKELTNSTEALEWIDKLEFSSDLLLQAIDSLIEISKLEKGKMDVDSTVFNIKTICDDIVAPYIPLAKFKNVEFSLNISDTLPNEVIGDSGIVKRIILNILSNAFKYTKTGKIAISVEKEKEDNEYINIVFTITDTGIGISEVHQKAIFEPFYQEDSSYTKKYQGLGLGLAIAKRFLELTGGEIYLESIKGNGTKFYVYFIFKKIVENASE